MATSLSRRGEAHWRMLFAALVIVAVGVLLMLHGSNMLFGMESLAIFVAGLAAILIFGDNPHSFGCCSRGFCLETILIQPTQHR